MLKNQRGSKNTSVTKLQVRDNGKSISSSSNPSPTSTDSSKNRKNASKLFKKDSEQTLSIQNLQFPEPQHNKFGTFKVKCQKDLLAIADSKSSKEKSSKERGYDFTTSTNSHYDGWIMSIPKKFRTKCSSNSTNNKQKSRKSSDTILTYDGEQSQDKVNTSQEIRNSSSIQSIKKHDRHCLEPNKESFVAGAPRKFIGKCPSNYEQLSKMSKSRQKFFLTQDPRKVHCLINPETLHPEVNAKNKELNTFTNMVKHAQNICADDTKVSADSSENFICEVIDLENPLQLDFQGLDYANTYQKDEQDLQNQRNYRRVCRHMQRRRVRAETQSQVEGDLRKELVNIPKCFEVRDRTKSTKPTPPQEPSKLGKLFRAADKLCNQKIIKKENDQRKERYKDLYLRNRARKEQDQIQAEIRKKLNEEKLPITLADDNFKKLITTIDDTIDRCNKKEMILRKPETRRRIFPHSMKETMVYKRELKQKNREARDEAKIVKDFFKERLGRDKQFPAAELDISSDTPRPSVESGKMTEQSSDDEDNMEVGKQGSKFKLRGFQFKLTSNIRGKFHQREKQQGVGQEKGCITRDQWLKEIAPQKENIKLDVEMGIQKIRSPDDPQLLLFPPVYRTQPPKAQCSAIRDFIMKPLGRHYDRLLRKPLKFTKPRLRYSVKKFNLISYRFGDASKRFAQHAETFKDSPSFELKTTKEYMEAKSGREKLHQQEVKQNRLQLLGIPYKCSKKSSLQRICANSSSSSSSEWVPKREPLVKESCYEFKKEKIPLRQLTNMPAPKYREPTLRIHPRHPRDYEQQRIPSAIFDQVVQTTAIPHMSKLPEDMKQFANVKLKKTKYTDIFEARHHHDHWNPTQVKQVNVHYQPQLVKPELTQGKNKTDKKVIDNFQMAQPSCNQFVEMNLTMPAWNIDEIIREHKKKNNKLKAEHTENYNIHQTKKFCQQKDFVLQTRDAKEIEDYPGRQEYLQLLNEVKKSLAESKQIEEPAKKLYVNKETILKELEQDLQSIESCLTSLSSSECSNLTNDSGSFLLMEGQEKIPLDFIRKSLVPFEELQRSRFQFIPIDADKEEANPFQVLPFSGQKKAQLELTKPKDIFFTFNTRLKNGLRLRLEVPTKDVRDTLIGGRHGSEKYQPVVANDIDENYIDELQNRPPIKMFNFKSATYFIKDALRLKFESLLIQGQMVRSKICDRLNDQHWSDMQNVQKLFERLFEKWEKHEYDASMAVVHKVKTYYEETDRLKNELKILEREQVILNMDIVFIESHWIRSIMLQNFHYLMADQEWRLIHDWIHRLPTSAEAETEETELENFEVSITKRSIVNVRERDQDNAWAIKSYYENVYLQNKHSNLIVFPNAESFLQGLTNLRTKTFIMLLELHLTFALHTELQHKVETFVELCEKDLKEREEFVNRKCAKLYFLQDRANCLSKHTLDFLDAPIAETFNDELFHRDRAIIAEAWRRIVPENMRSSSEDDLYPVDMVAMMSDVLLELIAKFETIPAEISTLNENKLRSKRAFLRKQSHQAFHTEHRIEREMKKVIQNLEPPYKKPIRMGKLPRYYIKKRKKSVVHEEKKISERDKLFLRAFNEDQDPVIQETSDIRDSITLVDNIQEEIVPFYFDHFLKLNGYTPNYNFKTEIEMRDGPEMERLRVRSVIPEIQQRMEQWQIRKKRIMEDNIAKNPNIYLNVMS